MRNHTFKLMLLVLSLFSVVANASSDVSVISHNDLINVHQTTASNYTASSDSFLQRTRVEDLQSPALPRDFKAEAIHNFQQDGSFFKLADMNTADNIY